MALQHDTDGFLVGDSTQLNEQVELLESIRDDIKAIRAALNGISANAVEAIPTQQTPVAGTAQNTVTNNAPNNTVINHYAGAVSTVNQIPGLKWKQPQGNHHIMNRRDDGTRRKFPLKAPGNIYQNAYR